MVVFFAVRPLVSGGFVDGLDYRGEPTPYSWPCIKLHLWHFDTCGFLWDNFWYYQSWWSDKVVYPPAAALELAGQRGAKH